MSGGTVSIKNPKAVSLAVNITGSGTFLKSGGGSASFPETITGDETFTTTSDGPYTLSVKYKGTEIAGSPDATVDIQLRAGCQYIIQPGPDGGFDFEASPATATTTNLNSAAAAINTTGKYTYKVAYNTTTNKLVVAQGGATTSTWISCDAATTYTPS
jgi:hypothetical protein